MTDNYALALAYEVAEHGFDGLPGINAIDVALTLADYIVQREGQGHGA